jgi:2-oxo-3-hexenedioate decarboxylase
MERILPSTIGTMLARELISVHETPREVPPFSATYPGLTAEAGYEAAQALHEHRVAGGWRRVGRKIGFTNRTIWPRYGVYEPIWGTVYDRTLVRAIDNRARVLLQGLVNPRIEPEICFGLRTAPGGGRLLDCIGWMAHSVEIVQCHHPAWKLALPDSTADNGLHGRLIVGEPMPLPKDVEALLPAVQVQLYRGEALVDRGVGANVLDSPLKAFEHLIALLARQRGAPPLEAGEIVTTGVITDAHPVRPGETWSTRLAGLPLPGLTVEFA